MGKKEVTAIEPDVIGDEVRILKDSKGNSFRVIIKNSVIKRGNSLKDLILDSQILVAIETLAATGASLKQISAHLNIDFTILQKLYNGKTKVYDHYKRGKQRGIMAVNNSLFAAAQEKGNIAAKLAWLARNEDNENRPKILNKNMAWERIESLNSLEVMQKYHEQKKICDELDKRGDEIEDKEDNFNRIFYDKSETK